MRARLLAVAALTAVLVVPALAGCGGSATDANEPNDEPAVATVLTPGTPLDGVLDSDDTDVFRCDAPAAGEGAARDGEPRPFVVTVRTDSPGDLKLQVGASIPDSWEGITWPGWEAVAKDDRLEVTAALAEGTVIMVLTGDSGSEYSIEIVWD